MSTDKISKIIQISEIIQSGGSFGSGWGNLANKSLTNIAIFLARDYLFRLISSFASNAINKFERKVSEKRAVRAGK